jgi:hypothetical protein
VTIGVELGATGSWTWHRDPNSWSVSKGIDSPDACVSVPPDYVVPVLTRGIALAEEKELLTIEGDEQLASGAMAVVAPLLGRP